MKQNSAFTLVELSIVLVILGLLVGGVLTGQSLIRAAELRSVPTQQARYQTAAMTFKDKYLAIPGDMNNAASYWGAADGGTGNSAGCMNTQGTGTQTCNGNGDGKILPAGSSNEYFRFWQHLANAGLIEGTYSGIGVGDLTYGATTANTPAGRISSSLWFAAYTGSISAGAAWMFDGQYGNTFEFGKMQANTDPSLPILTPADAYNIDMKMDDGKPATGNVAIRGNGTYSACTDASSGSTLSANYLLSNTTAACVFQFKNQF